MSFSPIDSVEGVTISLPEYVPTEQIGINMQRLGHLGAIAGFNEITITSFSGRTSSYEHSVVGHDGHGTAYAGATKKVQVDLSEQDTGMRADSRSLIHSHPPLAIGINVEEVNQRLADEKAHLRDPRPWAKALNQAVGEGLRQATWRHHVREMQPLEALLYLSGDFIGSVAVPEPSLERVGIALGGMNLIKYIFARTDGMPVKEICFSLFPMVHPDRAGIVSIASRGLRLVKAIESAKI